MIDKVQKYWNQEQSSITFYDRYIVSPFYVPLHFFVIHRNGKFRMPSSVKGRQKCFAIFPQKSSILTWKNNKRKKKIEVRLDCSLIWIALQ